MKGPGLKKIFKPKTIQPIFSQAEKVLGNDIGISLVENGKVIASTPAPSGSDPWRHPERISWPLTVGDDIKGHLVMVPLSNPLRPSFFTKAHRALGELLSNSLQEIIQRETARRAIAAETLDQYRESALLHRATADLNRSLRIQEVTHNLLQECQNDTYRTDVGIVFGFDPKTMRYEALNTFGPVDETDLEVIANSTLFKEVARKKKGEIINDLTTDHRWEGDVPGIHAMMCIPLDTPGNWSGMLVLGCRNRSEGFSAKDLLRVSTIASIGGTAMSNAYHFEEVQQMLNAMMKALATAIDARDPCTSGHSQRVAGYAYRFALRVNDDQTYFPETRFSEDALNEIYYAALLHDVGKIGVREEILTKSERLPRGRLDIIYLRLALWGELTGLPWKEIFEQISRINKANVISPDDRELVHRLSESVVQIGEHMKPLLSEDEKERLLIPRGNLMPSEWEDIRKHPAESHRILSHIPFPVKFKHILTIIRQHHEKLTGDGYPDRIDGNTIILQSRLVAIVDIFDALTATDRPYKKALPRHKALSILDEEAAKGFLDQFLTALFIRDVDAITREEAE